MPGVGWGWGVGGWGGGGWGVGGGGVGVGVGVGGLMWGGPNIKRSGITLLDLTHVCSKGIYWTCSDNERSGENQTSGAFD